MNLRMPVQHAAQLQKSRAIAGIVDAQVVMDFIGAVYLSQYVQSPYRSRGWLMLIGQPETLKTTFLLPLRHYPGVEVRSDLNVSSLNIMRGDMASGRCKAIVFGECAKLYARHDTTSMNLEKQLQALVDEGYWSASTEGSNVSLQTDCQIFGAMTDMFYQHHYQRWKEAGFLRRFLFARI